MDFLEEKKFNYFWASLWNEQSALLVPPNSYKRSFDGVTVF